MLLVSANQMQEMDKETIESFGIPGRVLMENAGRGAFDFLVNRYDDLKNKKAAVFAGRGNNGGDGFVIARYLIEKQIHVTVFLLSAKDRISGDARINLDLFQKLCLHSEFGEIIEVPDADSFQQYRYRMHHQDLFIDAILGTGLNSDVRGFFKDAIELMNNSSTPVFSIDIPSGLHSDSGKPLGTAVRADATAAFAFAKAGHILFPGNKYCGALKIIDIGIPAYIAEKKKILLSLIEPHDISTMFPVRPFESHKGTFGHLLILAGSIGKTGAAALCANAAKRCGTGRVTLGVAKSINNVLEPQVIEPMTHPLPEKKKGILTDHCLDSIEKISRGKQALAIGPGMGTHNDTKSLIEKIVKTFEIPLIIDADGINCLTRRPEILKHKKAPVIITPHPGEMSRLCHISTTQVQSDRVGTARRFSNENNTIVVLKGAQTIISMPDGKVFICPTGNPGMASGGMGDVLTGMIAGFCAQGFLPENACIAGVYIHGLCGDILSRKFGSFGFVAGDIIQIIPDAIHRNLK